MNRAKRTSLIHRLYLSAASQGIKTVLAFKDVPGKRVRRIGRFLSTPRTHSNRNRNRQRRRKEKEARQVRFLQRQHDRQAEA